MTHISALQFIVLALFVYRVTLLLVEDEIFARSRDWFWEKFPPESTLLGYLSTCPWCISLWVSFIVVLCYVAFPGVTFIIGCIFALSAVAGNLTARLH